MALLETGTTPRPQVASFAPIALRPGLAERVFVVAAMFLYAVSLPTNWLALSDATDTSSADTGSGPLASVVFLAIAGVAFMIVLPYLGMVLQLARLAPALVLLSGYLVLSTVWSEDPALTLRRSLALALTVFVAMYLVIRFERFEILRYAAITSALAIWLNVAFVVGLRRYAVDTFGEWDGVYSHRNTLGQYVTFFMLALVLQAAASPASRVWAVPSIGVGVVLLLGSTSKTSLGASVLLAALLVIYQLFRSRRVLFGAVAISLTAATAVAVAIVTANLPFFTALLERDPTLTGRTELWAAVLPEIAERPVLGAGYSAFWQGWFSPAHDIWVLRDWEPPSAHNAVLDYLLNIGAIGLALVLVVFLTALVRATRELRDQPGAVATFPLAVLSYQLLFSITEPGVLRRGLPWLVISAMVFSVALSQHLRRTAEEIPVEAPR